MLDKCKTIVRAKAQEIGLEGLTDGDLRAIDDRMNSTMKRLARQAPQEWMAKPMSERVSLAAEQIIADIQAEAARKVENAQRQILASAQTNARVEQLQGAHTGASRADGLKDDFEQADHYIKSIRTEATGQLMDTIKAAGDKQGAGMGRKVLMTLFDVENPAMTRDLVSEVFAGADGTTGNKVAQMGARAWLDAIEGLRQRFNAAGGDVRALAYGYLPQPHDVARIRKAGREAWAQATMQRLDRKQYVNEDGTRMTDTQVQDLLRNAWETITTEGQNKTEPGQYVSPGKRVNKGADERQLHFADGQQYAAYMSDFGRGTMYEAMLAHVGGMSRDIGLVERYGPDPAAQARLQFDLTSRADGRPIEALTGKAEINPQTYWDIISGKTGMPADDSLSRMVSTVRNLMTAAKLGGAILTSFADLGTLAITAGYNRLGYWQLMKDIGTQAKSHAEVRDFMAAHGMIAESLQSAVNRWSGDNLAGSWSGHMANSVMKWSLLNAWTDGLRQGFKLTMNAGLMRLAKTEWSALNEFDRQHLTGAGFTEADWGTMNKVAPTAFRGRELLTPEGIRATGDAGAQQLANRVLGFVQDESEFAIVNPDIRTRSITTWGGMQAGTYSGELARTVMQFKSFPIAMITRHWSRAMETPQGMQGAPALANRYLYGMALTTSLMGLGAITVQAKQLLSGQDPIDMNKPRFWAKALATGGALGIAGDMMLTDPSTGAGDAIGTFAKNLAGPAIGSTAELMLKNGVENVWQAAEGKDTHAAAEFASWVKGNTPGASLWWVKPLIEHGFMNDLNESLSPGYLGRMKQRAAQNWGTRYWWAPDQMEPDRAPNMAAAVGQ
jgi:hypothetical protein